MRQKIALSTILMCYTPHSEHAQVIFLAGKRVQINYTNN